MNPDRGLAPRLWYPRERELEELPKRLKEEAERE